MKKHNKSKKQSNFPDKPLEFPSIMNQIIPINNTCRIMNHVIDKVTNYSNYFIINHG